MKISKKSILIIFAVILCVGLFFLVKGLKAEKSEMTFTEEITKGYEKVYFTGTTNKTPLDYKENENMKFVITCYGDNNILPMPFFKYELSADDGTNKIEYIEGSSGVIEINTKCKTAGFVRLKVYPCDKDKKVIEADNIDIFDGGACAGFQKIKKSMTEPNDFDEFWEEQLSLIDNIDYSDYEAKEVFSRYIYKFDVYDMKIRAHEGSMPVSGYLSIPKNATKKSLKIRIIYQGYDVESAILDAEDGYITFQINPHGIENGKTDLYYETLEEKEYKDFGLSDNDPPEKSYFRDMILRDIIALRFIKETYKDLWNGKDIELNGASMGAFQAVAVAALESEKVTELSLDMPWLCDLGSEEKGRIGGWGPEFEDGVLYYDTISFASRLKTTVVVNIDAGLGDYVCPPSGVTALYNAIGCKKKSINFVQNKSHTYTPVDYTIFNVNNTDNDKSDTKKENESKNTAKDTKTNSDTKNNSKTK